jgi:hypothetical protein
LREGGRGERARHAGGGADAGLLEKVSALHGFSFLGRNLRMMRCFGRGL